jgi:uncharacterized protein (TIGR03437 family)
MRLRLTWLLLAMLAVFAGRSNAQTVTITPTVIPRLAALGQFYSSGTITASGAGGNYSWAISAGSLPPGLSLGPGVSGSGSGTDTITGSPTAGGTYTFTVTATALLNCSFLPCMLPSGSQSYTISIPQITSSSPLPNATVGSSYSFTFQYSDGPTGMTWGISNASSGGVPLPLPPGLTLNAGTGVYSGIPTSAGTYSFNITLILQSNVAPPNPVQTKTFSLTIGNTPGAALSITTTSLQDGTVGQAYSQTVTATGGTPPYSFFASGLPSGLSMDSGGNITGTPKSPGTSSVLINVADSKKNNATKTLSLTVGSGGSGTLAITTGSLPNGNTNQDYTASVLASGGSPPYSFSASGLPPGLSISASGVVLGQPSAGGNYFVTVTVTDSKSGQASRQYSVSINASLTIVSMSFKDGSVGRSYFDQVQAAGGTNPYTYFGTGLPSGLALTSQGNVSGTPDKAGTFTITVTVTDAKKVSFTSDVSITIYTQPSISTASPLPGASTGVAYSQNITATGGLAPYMFFLLTPQNSLPDGLTFSSAGVLSGTPTTAGTSTFTVQAIDKNQNAITKAFSLTVTSVAPPLTVTPPALQFTTASGDVAGPQDLTISTGGNSVVVFTATIDDGNGGPIPWLKVPAGGITPDAVRVTMIPSGLGPGTYHARIRLGGSTAGGTFAPIDVPVTLTVSNPPPNLTRSPTILRYRARVSDPRTHVQTFVLKNTGGGGPVPFTLSVVGKSPWIVKVDPSATSIALNAPVLVQVTVDTHGLPVGSFRDVIRVTTNLSAPRDKLDVPVSLSVAGQGPIMSVPISGLRLPAIQGNLGSGTRQVSVLNTGDAGSAVNWTAQAIRGADLVTLTTPTGSSTPGSPTSFGVRLSNTAPASPGGKFALIQVADPKALNAPQFVVVVADIAPAGTAPVPDPNPAGLLFQGSAGGANPAPRPIIVNTTSPSPVQFSTSVATDSGGQWLSAVATANVTSLASPASVTVSVTLGTLTSGIYTGTVNIGIGQIVRAVGIVLIVKPAGSVAQPEVSIARPRDAGCTPASVALAQTGTIENFSIPAGWPATLSVQAADNCGSALTSASVVASFSNGDPPISLAGDQVTGIYSATWQPGAAAAQMTVTLDATSGGLAPAEIQLAGNVDPNANPAPSLVIAGLLNNLNAQVGAPLAPGTVSQVYGDNLTTAPDSPSTVPLPTLYKGVAALVGGMPAPIYYISKTQLTVQVPSELAPSRTYYALLVAGDQFSLPQEVDLVPVAPGTVAFPDGRLVAQHADFTLVDANHPAKPGETVTIYLVGMGATTPAVASGNPAPLNPLAKVPSDVRVTVDGQSGDVSFSGLTPGGVGLYQINFKMPAGLRTGSLDVVITQDGVAANATKLLVSN